MSLLLSSIWVQATSAENNPANFEAMAHTYNIALLFTRAKVSQCLHCVLNYLLSYLLCVTLGILFTLVCYEYPTFVKKGCWENSFAFLKYNECVISSLHLQCESLRHVAVAVWKLFQLMAGAHWSLQG